MWFPRLRRSKRGQKEAEKALEEAQKANDDVRALARKANQVHRAMKIIADTNHFAEKLEGIIIRPRGPVNE